jgi:outer membrane protein OmpA-like peptidoglycan-associated protein
MATITEVQKTYEIITGSIYACKDYTPPSDLSSNARGTSNELAFPLNVGDKITVIQLMRRVENGAIDSSEPVNPQGATQAAFEVVKATVEGKTGEYFVWVVYNGVEKVKLFITNQEEEPTSPPTIPVDKAQKIEVRAGQTIVLDVKTDSEKRPDQENNETGTGSIEVELVNEKGEPYDGAEVVHLIGDKNIYTVAIDKNTGKGIRENILPGEYELALQLGSVHFEFNKDSLIKAGEDALRGIANKLSTKDKIDFAKIRCVGYADNVGSKQYNEGLCLKRAVSVKSKLGKIQSKIKDSYISTGIGGELPGDSEEEKKINRKVDVFGVI